ncbi:MAG TPA: transposase [Candidatus Methylomirabilis sp.]|nr:transposase [Candidatus Methylomirabilis sp.]
MGRFCAYIDKVFHLGSQLGNLTDARAFPHIPTAAAFAGVLTLFATRRGSLNGLEQDLRIPARLQGLVGAQPPSVDSISRIYALMDSQPLRQLLCDIAHQLKRNKALTSHEDWYVAAIDGHEFFSSRKRCCPHCQRRTLTVDGQPVTEYYHQGVVCHLIGQSLALVLDVELLRPGEGEETAAKRLLERVFAHYPRFFDIVVGDALYFDAPFINFCLDRHKHVIVTAKGDQRLLLRDAQGLFCQQPPGCWVDKKARRTVRYWDEEGFTSCEGVKRSLRVLRTEETVGHRERIAGQWQETEEVTTWCWATTLSKTQLSTRGLWRCGHGRWDIENDCFNTLATHWGWNHCFKHAATAIVNFLLTSFIVSALLQSFWLRNLKPALRTGLTLIGLARELDRGLVGCRAPWSGQLARAP